jgi:predicted transcriptional regulator
MKYRSRTDIAALILEAANGGAAKTKIMYRAFLSYAQLKEYLAMLLENALIEYKEEDQIFKITEKGIHFLQLYSQVGELISANNCNHLIIYKLN